MARDQSTGVLRIYYVPTIANKSAPTVAELNAGVNLTGFLTRDGLNTPMEGETADASDVSDAYNSTAPGNYGGQPITATFHRDGVTASDTAWNTLPRTTAGYFAIRRFGGSATAWAATQKVEVWPVTVISRAPLQIAANETQKFMATCAVTTPPVQDATVAA